MDRHASDIAILGGGLAGALIALELAASRPELSVLLVEGQSSFGGNHIWSFFQSDISPQDSALVDPLVVSRWTGYDVHFQGHSRRLRTPYRSITSERLNRHLHEVLPEPSLLTGTPVVSASQRTFTLADGQTYRTGGVIDARGIHSLPHMQGGWQKFAGQVLTLEQPHGLDCPIVMDARVEQVDGYRFVYCLPFSPNEVFVEDTYYSDTPDLDLPKLRARIAEYATTQDWTIASVSREETGVLPVIAAGDFQAFWETPGNRLPRLPE
ncbi:MAG: lycopene cyclase, partial [Hyphomicrobiales bacterium]